MLILALLLAAPQQAKAALDRNAVFMARADGLTAEYQVKAIVADGVGAGKLELRKPNLQRFSLNWETQAFRFTQSAKGSIAIRDDLRDYLESPRTPSFVQPPGAESGLADIGYPNFLISKSVREYVADAEPQYQGQESVQGQTCDKVFIVSQIRASSGRHTFWIDPQGRVLRWLRVISIADGPVEITFDFTKVVATSPSDSASYANDLPVGYMPHAIPETTDRTRMVANRAWFGSWLDLRQNKKVDVAALAKGSFVAMVFTDPDCAICARIEPFLVDLRRQLKAKGCALLEVSLGTKMPDVAKKDKDRTVFWDNDGRIELAYGTPGTPFFFVADKAGLLVRGWQGYTKQSEAKIKKELLMAFEPAD